MVEKKATTEKKEENMFRQLNSIDVSKHVEKKGTGSFQLSYLSWVWAWTKMKEIDPNATREYTKFDEYNFQTDQLTGRKVDYMLTNEGCYVECTVTIKEHSETEQLYVMDYANKAIPKPDMAQINKAKQRCFVKAVALHGLGLYIYAGEDLPNKDIDTPKTDKKSSQTQNGTIKGITEIEKGQISRGVKVLAGLTKMPEEDVEKTVKSKFKFSDVNSINSVTASKVIQYIAESVKDLQK